MRREGSEAAANEDRHPGLAGRDILIAESAEDTLRYLRDLSEAEGRAIGARARARVLAEHTAEHRAAALEEYVTEARQQRMPVSVPVRRPRGPRWAQPVTH